MKLLPKVTQFRRWSLPSKYALFSIILGVIGLILTIILYLYPIINKDNYSGGIFSVESNIVDKYFNNKKIKFKFTIHNSSKNTWNNIKIYGYTSIFVNKIPNAPDNFLKIWESSHSHLISNTNTNINISHALQELNKKASSQTNTQYNCK